MHLPRSRAFLAVRAARRVRRVARVAAEIEPMPQVIGQVRRRRVAVGHPLGEAFQADPLELFGDASGRAAAAAPARGGGSRRRSPRCGSRQTAGDRSACGRVSRRGPRCRSGRRAGGSRREPVRVPCKGACRRSRPHRPAVVLVHRQAEVGDVRPFLQSSRMFAGFKSR